MIRINKLSYPKDNKKKWIIWCVDFFLCVHVFRMEFDDYAKSEICFRD